jgi:biopolymer transport protein ExbB/TolQ
MDIQERFNAFAMLGATWVMWLLVILSVVGLAVILERAYYFFATGDDIEALRKMLREKLGAKDLEGAREGLKKGKGVEAMVALAGVDSASDGYKSAEERMNQQQMLSKLTMERNLAFLGTMGNNAPFIGLLGTVIGIMRAFREMNEAAGQVTTGLMSEIGEALVATAIGLIVALPSVAAYNLFQRLIKARVTRAEALGKEVLAYLKSSARSSKED